MLSFCEESPISTGHLLAYDDYFKVIDRYIPFLNQIDNEKIETKQSITQENKSCDYATLVLLKNFLFKFKNNDNAKIIQDMLETTSAPEDIELLYEEGLLTIDTQSPENKLKKDF